MNIKDESGELFAVEDESGSSIFWLSWPSHLYHHRLRGTLPVAYVEVSRLTDLAHQHETDFPDLDRLKVQLSWFQAAASGKRTDWPQLPVVSILGTEWAFVDGRHRCEALELLGAFRVPVLLTKD